LHPREYRKVQSHGRRQLRFLDSFQHMGMGLDKLVECLGGKIEKFPLTVNYFTEKGYSIDKIKLLFRKGSFHMTGQMHGKNLTEQASCLERTSIHFLVNKILVKKTINMHKKYGKNSR
jgi:hypothetical protein